MYIGGFLIVAIVAGIRQVHGAVLVQRGRHVLLVEQVVQDGQTLPLEQPLLLGRQGLVVVVDRAEKLKVGRVLVRRETLRTAAVFVAKRRLLLYPGGLGQRAPGALHERFDVH